MFASNIVNSFDHTDSIASPVFLIIIFNYNSWKNYQTRVNMTNSVPTAAVCPDTIIDNQNAHFLPSSVIVVTRPIQLTFLLIKIGQPSWLAQNFISDTPSYFHQTLFVVLTHLLIMLVMENHNPIDEHQSISLHPHYIKGDLPTQSGQGRLSLSMC